MPYRVAFLGFSEFERTTLASNFRLAHDRSPAYEQVPTLTDADFLVADADHGPSVQLVQAIERLGETVFIGSQAPEGQRAWLVRPINALHVMRELDGLAARALHDRAPREEYAGPNTTIVQLARQRRGAAMAPPTHDAPHPLTLRDPQPGAAPSLTGPAAPDDDLVAHEPPLPVTRAPEPEAEWLPPPPAPPAATSAATPRAKQPRPPKAQRVSLVPPTPRVLLVDDSAIALRFLEVRLGGWQLEVDRAATSQAAISLLAQHSYDIVFLDIELGEASEMDGLTLCQRIKHTPALLSSMVILISAHHSELDRVRGALAGCDAYLAKPLDMHELQRLMARQGVRAVSSESAGSG